MESYSRIENGRKPTRNNYKALTEKIGTENRYYIELVNTGNIDALLLRREISYELFMERNERLPELLEELKKVLGEKEVAKNRRRDNSCAAARGYPPPRCPRSCRIKWCARR